MKRIPILILFVFGVIFSVAAQDSNAPINPPIIKDHAWEVGLHGGHFFTDGNVDFVPGYAGGIHVRRALDYVFSLRLDILYGSASGEDAGNIRSFSNTWFSGSLQAIASLNNLKWTQGERKTNIYVLTGLGLNSFEAELESMGEPVPGEKIERDGAGHGEIGAGIAFKINDRVNIGLEHKAMFVFGDRGDLLDAVKTFNSPDGRSTFRDAANYTSIRLNFNMGKKDEKTEPLYWLNPLDGVLADIKRLEDTRVTFDDSDSDGVIDRIDEEENTPEGAVVNSKGVAMDSDGDGIQDHLDKEPYSSSQYPTDADGVAQMPDMMAQVEEMINAKLKDFQPKTTEPAPAPANPGISYLPSIYFDNGRTRLSSSALGILADLSKVMKQNPNLKFVVTGYTDQTGSKAANDKLSYNRAKVVVDKLTEVYGVDRSALILNWKGESDSLTEGSNLVNRRVEFKIATNETEMAPPSN
jgi:outer membrane protein OmpA-like peptidoglycan-associated protein/opacity protein-like surface antigen